MTASDPQSPAKIPVPQANTYLEAFDLDHISLRRACEALGIDYSTQLRKLRSRSWAVVVLRATVGADGKTYQMATVNTQTFVMWLATIDENAVSEDSKPVVVAFQCHAADALENHFRPDAARLAAEYREEIEKRDELIRFLLEWNKKSLHDSIHHWVLVNDAQDALLEVYAPYVLKAKTTDAEINVLREKESARVTARLHQREVIVHINETFLALLHRAQSQLHGRPATFREICAALPPVLREYMAPQLERLANGGAFPGLTAADITRAITAPESTRGRKKKKD